MGTEVDFTYISGVVGDQANVKIYWTCTSSLAGPWNIGFGVDGNSSEGAECSATTTSGWFFLSTGGSRYGVSTLPGEPADGKWTATIYVWR